MVFSKRVWGAHRSAQCVCVVGSSPGPGAACAAGQPARLAQPPPLQPCRCATSAPHQRHISARRARTSCSRMGSASGILSMSSEFSGSEMAKALKAPSTRASAAARAVPQARTRHSACVLVGECAMQARVRVCGARGRVERWPQRRRQAGVAAGRSRQPRCQPARQASPPTLEQGAVGIDQAGLDAAGGLKALRHAALQERRRAGWQGEDGVRSSSPSAAPHADAAPAAALSRTTDTHGSEILP